MKRILPEHQTDRTHAMICSHSINLDDPIDVAKDQRYQAIKHIRKLDLEISELKASNKKLKAENYAATAIIAEIKHEFPDLVTAAAEVAKTKNTIQKVVAQRTRPHADK